MEADKLIEAFIQVIKEQDYVFSPQAIEDIPALQKNLTELETQPLEVVAEAIRQWYINYEDVRDAVLNKKREISKVEKASPASQENTLENRYRVLQEELQHLQDRKKADNKPK